MALVPAAVLAWRSRKCEHLGYFHDDGLYWVCGKSLAEGHGYRILSLPGAPFQTKYPPVFPLLLAGVWRVSPDFPANLPAAMLVTWSILPLALYLIARLLESWGCGRTKAVLLAAWIALNPYIVFFGANLMAEVLFAGLVAACLIAARTADQRNSSYIAFSSGLLGAVACLTKTSGIPLIAGALWFALRRRYRLSLWFAAPLVAALTGWGWWAGSHIVPSSDVVTIYYTSYVGDMLYDLRGSDLLIFVRQNIPALLNGIGSLIIPDMVGVLMNGKSLSQFIALFAVAGVVRDVRRNGTGLQHWFVAGYCAMLLIWHYPPNERFLIPTLPLFVFGFAAELEHLLKLVAMVSTSADRRQRMAARAFTVLLCSLGGWCVAMLCAAHVYQIPASYSRTRSQFVSNMQTYKWINEHVRPDAKVLTYYDVPTFLYTGRSASRFANFPKQAYRQDAAAVNTTMFDLPEYARTRGFTYLIATDADKAERFVAEAVDWKRVFSSPAFSEVYRAPRAVVYRIDAQPTLASR